MNEVIRAVLNLFFFLHFTKRFCMHQKHQKHQKHKSTKTQPTKSTKCFMRTKIKNVPKNIYGEKSHLFAYLHFCAFCARKEKRKASTMLSIGAVRWCVKSVWAHLVYNCKCIHTDLNQLSEPRCVSRLIESTLIF